MINENITPNLPSKGSTPPQKTQNDTSHLTEKYAGALEKKLPQISKDEPRKLSRSLKKIEGKEAGAEKTKEETEHSKADQAIFQQLAQIPAAEQPLHPLAFTVTIPPSDAKTAAQAAQPVISAMEKRRIKIAEALQQANLTSFKEEELKIVSSFLVHYELTDTLIKNITSNSPNLREDGIRLLRAALLHSLLTASVKESMMIMGVYRTLFPNREDKGENLTQIENIALVLGDAFIHDSGYEGGISPRPYANFAVELLNTSSTPYKNAEALKYVLKNPINLREPVTVQDLGASIKKTLASCPGDTPRCLFFGGWAEHAIVYEIEKKTNGRYAFRVYNEGDGINYHENINANHKTKYAGCIAIEEIPEHLLFQPAFLTSLQALCSVNNGSRQLVEKILPLLGGKEEALAPEIQQYLSPQRSGVCTYRSLQAFMAHALSAEEYKKFKFEYKLLLLDKYLPQLESKAKQKIKEENYWETVKEYALLKRCLEKFSNGIANLSAALDPSDIEKAHVTVLEYKFFIDKLERRLLAYEKTSIKPLPEHSSWIQDFPPPAAPMKIHDPTPTASISSQHLSQQKMITLKAIQEIPERGQEPALSQAIETCLGHIMFLSTGERWQLLDLLFKKIGSLDAISRIHFSNPQNTLSALHALLSDLISGSDGQELEKLCIYYSCYALYERAFRLLPESHRVLSADFPSFLINVDLSMFQHATCCDPFWVSRFNELQELQKKERRSPFFVPDIYKNKFAASSTDFQLDNALSKEIVSWWSDPNRPWNIEVPNQLTLKKEYAEKYKELSGKKEKLEVEISELKKEVAEIQKALSEADFLPKMAQLQLEIAKKHAEISNDLLNRCILEETALIENQDFMQAWEKIKLSTRNKRDSWRDSWEEIEEQKALNEQKLSLFLSKLDVDFVKNLKLKQAELVKLESHPFLKIYNLQDSEILLFKKKAEADLLALEMEHLQNLQKEKLTPLSLSLSDDRLTQQKNILMELTQLRNTSLNLNLEQKRYDLEIALMEHMQNKFLEEANFPFLDRYNILERVASRVGKASSNTPISDLVEIIINEKNSSMLYMKNPLGLEVCIKELKRLKSTKKYYADREVKERDKRSLAITQLEGRPNHYDHQEHYWPYGWEKGDLSEQNMAAYLFGSKAQFLQEKLKVHEVVPSELKQLYHQALLVKHYWGQKTDVPPLIPIKGTRLREAGSSTPTQSLSIESRIFTPPKPDSFNQYKRLESQFGDYFTVFKDKIPEENIHSQRGPLYNFTEPVGVPLSPEEFLDLASLHQSNIQIETALNYFEEHADLLSKPEWVEALHYLLFEKNILLNELQDPLQNQKTLVCINSFFIRLMAQAERLADFSLMGNLLWTKSLIQNYIDYINLTSDNKAPIPPVFSPNEISICMKKILHTPASSENLRIFFEACTAASSFFDLKNCPTEDVGYILLANVLRNLFPVQKDPISLRSRQLDKAEFNIQKLFTENPDLKALEFFHAGHWQVLKKLYTHIDELQQDDYQPDTLVNKDQSLRVCFSAGRIQSSDPTFLNRYENPLSHAQKEVFKRSGLFTEERELSQLRSCYNGNEIFIKKLPEGPLFTLRKKPGSSIEIPFMKIALPDGKSAWGEWIPETKATDTFRKRLPKYTYDIANSGITQAFHCFALSSGTIKEKRVNLQMPGGPTVELGNEIPDLKYVLCDKGNLQPCYMSGEHPKPEITDKVLLDLKTGYQLVEPSKTFSEFELIHYINCWADDTMTLRKIDFPRFNLSFKKDKGMHQFACEQYPGWHLDIEQFVPHLNPTTGFIRLRRKDDKTKKILTKVLIPRLDAYPIYKDEKGETKRALNNPYQYDYERVSKDSNLSYCEYDLVDKILMPKTLEAKYHLANIYLQKGYQDEAEALLFDPAAEVTTRSLSLQERALLINICKPTSSEKSGRNLRLKMHALYLLERDNQIRGKDPQTSESAADFEYQRFDITREYLNRLNHIKRLEKREEDLLLYPSDIIQESFNVINRPHTLTLKLPLPLIINKNVIASTQEPELRFRTLYAEARKTGSFPFEITDHTSLQEELPKYIHLLKDECQKVTDLEAARNNGLIPMLFYLISYGSHNSKGIASELLNVIYIKYLEPIKTTPIQKSEVYEVKKKPLPILRKASQSLVLLKEVKASTQESSYLTDACARYLQQKPYPSITPSYFDEDSPKAKADPAVKEEFQALNENIHIAAERLQSEKKHVLKQENLLNLLQEVKETYELQKQSLKGQEIFILQNITSALLTDPVSGLLFSSGKKSIPALEELCLLCARLTAEEDLQKAYPQLSAEGRKHLIGAVQEYLIQKRFVQHLDRVQEKISEIISGTKNKTLSKTARNLMIQELGKSMSQPPAFDMYTDPLARVYLTIETTLKIKLRQEQVDTISKFNASIHEGKDITIQMIMGSGKTSVIQPILAFLLAKKDALSTVYVPASLYETVKSALQKSLGNSFQQFVYAYPFTKNLTKDMDYLKTYLDRLKEAKTRQAVVLLTPQQKYALYSALKEAYAENEEQRCNLLADICRECMQTETAQIDEIDMCLDPTVVYKFPIGQSRMIDGERAKIVTELVLELANDEAFSKKVSIDFIDAYKLRKNEKYKVQGKAISAELFESDVKPLLIQKAELLLARHISNYAEIKSQDNQKYISHFLNKSTPFDQDIRKQCTPEKEDFLREKLENSQLEGLSNEDLSASQLIKHKLNFEKDRNAWIETLFGTNKQLVAICSKAINSILKQSLIKECGSNYSHDPELETKGIFTARPYLAPHSPKSSIPSDSFELAIYSMQNLLFNGVPTIAVEKILAQWRKETLALGKDISASPSYREYLRIMGDDATRFILTEDPPQKELIDILQKRLSKDPKALLDFMEKYVFRQIVDFEKSISTTPLAGLTGFNKQRIGYTGTVNPGILPKNMQVYREKGTEGKILLVIDNKLEKDICHIYEFSRDQKEYAEQLIDKFKAEPDLYTFIDSGNWLKDVHFKNWLEQLIKEVSAKRPEVQGVVYPDEKGNWFSLEKDLSTGTWISIPVDRSVLKPEQRLTIIPSKHETGTDIKQPPTARALNSIRKGMTLRDALQSVFRMRELFAGQQIDFALSKEVSEHIDPQALEEISPEALGTYLLTNQIEDSFAKNEIATLHGLYEILEAPVRQRLVDTQLPYAQRKELFNVLEDLFISKKIDDSFQEVCREKRAVPQGKGIEYHINKILDLLDFNNLQVQAIFQNREAVKHKLLAAVDLKSLPKMLTIGGSHESNEIEIDIDIEKEQQQQQDQQIEVERDIENHAIPAYLKPYPYKPLADLAEDSGYVPRDLFSMKPNPIESLLPEAVKPLFRQDAYSLEFSDNLFPTQALTSEYHLPGRYLLMLKNPGQKDRIVLVSHKDAELIKQGMLKNQQPLAPNQTIALVSLNGQLSASAPNDISINLTNETLQQAIVQAKLLTGIVKFTEPELTLLEENIIKKQGPQYAKAAAELGKLYVSVLSWMPDSAKLYPICPIKTLFQKYSTLRPIIA